MTAVHASPDPAKRDEENAISLLGVWRAVSKHWAMALSVAVAVAVGVTFYTLGQKELYLAKTTVQIDPRPPTPLGREVQTLIDQGSVYWSNKEYYETQYSIIKSRRIAELTVRELALHKDVGFLRNLPEDETQPPMETSVESAAQVLRNRLRVGPVKDSRLAIISYEDANPKRAQRILSVVADNYIRRNLDDMLDSTSVASDWLRGQLGKLKVELEDREMALHTYQKENGILSMSLEDQIDMLRAEMLRLNHALTDARTKREEISSRRAELKKVNPKEPSALPVRELLESGLLGTLRGQYVDARREHQALIASGKGERHPSTAQARARVELTRDALMKEIQNIKGAMDRDYSATGRQVHGLGKLFDRAKRASLDLNLLQIEYARLRRSKDNTEKLYSLVLDRTKETDLQRVMGFNNIRVVDSPLKPKNPVYPNVPVNVAFGVVAGLALGIFVAFGREQLDRTIKTPADIEQEIGLHFLGLVPRVDHNTGASPYGRKERNKHRKRTILAPGEHAELLVHRHPTSGIAESARAIRTNLTFMSPDKPFTRLLVTSAGPSEGKTTVACFIATAMAQAGQRVLLLDCDMRRPRLHRVFDTRNDHGVTTHLLGEITLDEAVLSTEVPNLFVLPAGPLPPNPAELLESERFSRLLDELNEKFDRVVLDSPPVVPVTDAVVLATRCDATVLVVRGGKTTKEFARQGRRTLTDVGARVAGAVMNDVDLAQRNYGYYQYYYYKRDGYGEDSESGEAA